jgi:hypothetical protein
MSAKEVIKAAVAKLEVESKNYYQSANEVLYTSLAYATMSFAVFAVSSLVIPSKLIPIEDLKVLIGFGGGGASSGITLAWGFRQRLERRDKARQIEAQRVNLERLSEIPNLSDQADQTQIANRILELTLRTISAPYEFPRETTNESSREKAESTN